MARELMSQTKRQGDKVAENASNKRKWEVTTMEIRAKRTKRIRCLEHTQLSQATRKSMLETYHCVTSASITTLARVRQSVVSTSRKKCPLLKFLNCVDKYWKGKARDDSSVTTSNVNI
ncbi:hypothetical protein Tco_0960883 [Tanacetum coccineum]